MKEFMFEGWSISLVGPHMKDEESFVKETKRFWNDDESKAKEAWKTAQALLNEQKAGQQPAAVATATEED